MRKTEASLDCSNGPSCPISVKIICSAVQQRVHAKYYIHNCLHVIRGNDHAANRENQRLAYLVGFGSRLRNAEPITISRNLWKRICQRVLDWNVPLKYLEHLISLISTPLFPVHLSWLLTFQDKCSTADESSALSAQHPHCGLRQEKSEVVWRRGARDSVKERTDIPSSEAINKK